MIQVLEVPLANPAAAQEIAEPRVVYPDDPDNRFDPAEHGLNGFNPLRGCHDIGVFVELRLAGAAYAEQAQLWRIGPDGIPDTANPIWLFDDSVDVDGPRRGRCGSRLLALGHLLLGRPGRELHRRVVR